jgi:N-acetylglucosamine repressor
VRATRSTSRDINRRIILNLVRENQPISRADLARRMNIGRGMITSLVTELIESGELYSGSTVTAPRGRRPEMLYVRTGDKFAIGVDVRLSRTYLQLSDFAGRAVARDSFETLLDPHSLVKELGGRIRALLDENDAHDRCSGIGIAVPGMVDRDTGRVIRSPQLGWENVEIRESLAAATHLRVQIENAPIACALARMWLGDADDKAPQNFVYVTVSDGVGTAIVARGDVVRGAGDTAGEFGHVPLDRNGPDCMCGARGCLEAHTSNLATIARYLGREFSPQSARELATSSGVSIDDIIEKWKAGDSRAKDALAETAKFLGEGLAIIVNAVNPGVIFVGGEITEAWELFAPAITSSIERRALTQRASRTPVLPEPSGAHPRLTGATALVTAASFAAPVIA